MAKYDHIDFKPPQNVAKAAALGLRYREEHGRGGTEVGVARARDLSNRRNVSPETIGRMVSYFARHEVDKQGKGWADASDPSAGYIAWLLWGGDAGQRWANKVSRQMDAADAKSNRSSAPAVVCADQELGYPTLDGDILRGVRLFVYGLTEHPMGDFTVDRTFAADMVSAWQRLAEERYFAPLLVEHTADGHAYGFIYDLRVDDKGVVADFKLTPSMVAAYEAQELAYVSPSFYPQWTHPHTGEELRHVLREVSFVSVPHLKNIGALHPAYSLSEGFVHLMESPMDQEKDPEVENMEEGGSEEPPAESAEITPEALMAFMGEVSAKLDAVMEMLAGAGGGDDEPLDNGEKVAKLQRRLDLAEARADIAQALPHVKGQELIDLAELKLDKPALYASTAKLLTAKKSQTQQPIGNSAPGVSVNLDDALRAIAKEKPSLTYAQRLDEAIRRNPALKGQL